MKLQGQLDKFYQEMKPFLPPELLILNQEYKTIDFPFQEIKIPKLLLTKQWSIQQLIGYLSTWSAFQLYLQVNSKNKIDQIFKDLINSISSEELIEVEWELFFSGG